MRLMKPTPSRLGALLVLLAPACEPGKGGDDGEGAEEDEGLRHRLEPARRPHRVRRERGREQRGAERGERARADVAADEDVQPQQQRAAHGRRDRGHPHPRLSAGLLEHRRDHHPQEVAVALDRQLLGDVVPRALAEREVPRIPEGDERVITDEPVLLDEPKPRKEQDACGGGVPDVEAVILVQAAVLRLAGAFGARGRRSRRVMRVAGRVNGRRARFRITGGLAEGG